MRSLPSHMVQPFCQSGALPRMRDLLLARGIDRQHVLHMRTRMVLQDRQGASQMPFLQDTLMEIPGEEGEDHRQQSEGGRIQQTDCGHVPRWTRMRRDIDGDGCGIVERRQHRPFDGMRRTRHKNVILKWGRAAGPPPLIVSIRISEAS